MNLRRTPVTLAAMALLLAGCASREPAAETDVLVAAKAASAPLLDGDAGDAVWAAARPMTVKLADGANFADGKGQTTATLKAVYSGDRLYILLQYDDPTNSVRRGPYQKQADGSWKKLKDPKDQGGDDNVYYEDKWAMLWNINNSIVNFDRKGCAVACHVGEGKPFGNKYLATEGQLGDLWHYKSQRTGPLGKVDDQYLDHTRYDPKASPNAGRKSDPGGPEYKGFDLVDGKPAFMHREGRPTRAGGRHYIIDGEQVPFDDARFKAGDEVASYFIYPLKGDRADIDVAHRWANGRHTTEISRRLVTGSRFDVQFSDLSARYGFGVAAFDNAQVQHATSDEPLYLRFEK